MYRHPMILSAVAAGAVAALSPQSAAAQNSTQREVVQPLPSSEVQRLNRALMELARRPRQINALVEAADASMAVGDLDAAVGFYGRAADIEPTNPQVKIGLARVYLRSGRPVEAIPLLNAARSAGASAREVLSEQALAYDLVGDQTSAQAAYSRAIELNPQDDEARRRLAVSYAISGNAEGFTTTLAPLVEARNTSALRTQAFGLAILGEQERAEGIVNASMPRDLAQRINPYLAYMPRLTPAQKAAAANLGIFPRAADIGREDPRIARFAREGAAGSLLEPAGQPLGAPVETVSQEVVQADAEPPAARALPQLATSEVSGSPSAAASESASVANAFADLGEGEMPVTVSRGNAVDIASIDVPREVAPEPEPAEPEHPRRIWVQLATGRDVGALRFDWRRFVRRAPELLGDFEPHVTPWGQANRLLAGPVADRQSARSLINALAEEGIETFSYTSPEGTEIQELN